MTKFDSQYVGHYYCCVFVWCQPHMFFFFFFFFFFVFFFFFFLDLIEASFYRISQPCLKIIIIIGIMITCN